jgi:hypothetical protein
MPFTHEKTQVKTVVSVLPHIFGQKKIAYPNDGYNYITVEKGK